jgi:hypothetical protein
MQGPLKKQDFNGHFFYILKFNETGPSRGLHQYLSQRRVVASTLSRLCARKGAGVYLFLFLLLLLLLLLKTFFFIKGDFHFFGGIIFHQNQEKR